MPDTYQCQGNGSCIIRLEDGQTRALSVALFHDTTMHGDGIEHVNVWIYVWPVGIAEPDWTTYLGHAHRLPIGEDITIVVAPDTELELRFTVRAETIQGR